MGGTGALMDDDEYEDSFPPECFYTAHAQTDATTVPSAAWFVENPGYAHALYSLERRLRTHFPGVETQLVIGAIINALALPSVRYLTVTDDFFLQCGNFSVERDYYKATAPDYKEKEEEDDDEDDKNGIDKGKRDAFREGLVTRARTRAVNLLLKEEILKLRSTTLNPDYPVGGVHNYRVPPFHQMLDKIAKLDVEEQYQYDRRNKRLRLQL